MKWNGVSSEFINKYDLLNNLNQEALFQHYFGIEVEIRRKYRSILREDKNPGCRFEWQSGILYFIDNIRPNGQLYWDIFACISKVYSVTYRDAITIVAKDYKYVPSDNVETLQIKIKQERPTIRFTHIPFPEDNLFFLPNDVLNKEGVFLVEDYWIGKGNQLKKNSIHNPRKTVCVAYYFPDSDHTKLYFPNETEYRWYSNCDIEDVFGKYKIEYYKQHYDYIVITKSQKDRLILDYHMGIPAIATQNEMSKIGSQVLSNIEDLRKLIIYDNDDTGIRGGQQLAEKINGTQIIIDVDEKDVYEIFKNFGEQESKKLIQSYVNLSKIAR